MSQHTIEVRQKLSELRTCLEALNAETVAAAKLPAEDARKLGEVIDGMHSAIPPLLQSVKLIEETGLDIVDMEVRLSGETDRLAKRAKQLREFFATKPDAVERLGASAAEIGEKAQAAGGALFPSGVRGLKETNRKIRDFKLQKSRYRNIRDPLIEKERISSQALEAVESRFESLDNGFGAVDELLNKLAKSEISSGGVENAVGMGQASLDTMRREAESARELEEFRPFRGILKETAGIIERVQQRLGKLQIPLFPKYADLGELKDCIEAELYAAMPGVSRFALLNIASKMRSSDGPKGNFLSEAYKIKIWAAFPDRIYFDADSSFIKDFKSLERVEKVSAALHVFRDGSFKQTESGKGNLQVSFQIRGNRVRVDADIDLYRSKVFHLFGEVIVNQLTGRKTDQYRVRQILADQGIPPIGGFGIYSPA